MTDRQRLDRLEQENAQLKRDIATIASLAAPHVSPKGGLLEIAERYSAGGFEKRPEHAPEQRVMVS